MRSTQITRVVALGVLLAASTAISTATASAAEFTVASCQADRLGFSTVAFSDFATRGMRIRRACNPVGPGVRGLVTTNVHRPGSVPRGSVALVTASAPGGTSFTRFRWAGTARRTDCRYALQLYAEGPGVKPVPIKNVRANQHCPGHGSALAAQAAGYRLRTFNVTGATRIVQRVICMGGNGFNSCSTAGDNYLRTYQAEIDVADNQPPTATIAPDTPLATGAWVAGNQPLNYDAEDNTGVRQAQAIVGNDLGDADQRRCAMATDGGEFQTGAPCPSGAGQITIRTTALAEGTQPLVVRAQDTAGNMQDSPPVTVRIDNTPPARVTPAIDGGDAWRNTNGFAVTWTNPPENDRAPIVAADYKLCPAGGGACNTAETTGADIARLPVQVPGPGTWTVSMWRKDAAGNADAGTASDSLTLRYDPEPPRLSFDTPSPSDPTLVSVPVSDTVSGLADGTIEISPAGSNTWTALTTTEDGSRLVARIDDGGLAAGQYLLRATAHDQAHNEASTTTRSDGQPMTVTLPLRIASTMQAGLVRQRTLRKHVRRHGRRRIIHKRVTVLSPAGIVRLGRTTQISGRLTNRDGQGIVGADIQVLATLDGAPEQLVGELHTDQSGSYTYTASGSASRRLRFVYAGSPLILPVESKVDLRVPAVSTLTVNRRHVVNGQSVMFSGQVRSLPLPASGKLIEVEVLLSGGWQTFRTVRTDATGRWQIPYRFARTVGVQWYRFRIELPREAGYPFANGASKSIRVRVRGQS